MKTILSLAVVVASLFVSVPLFAQAGDAAKGKAVFNQCSVCHNTDSTEKKIGPGLKGLFKTPKLCTGKPTNAPNVTDKINTGGNGMPSYKDILSSLEKANVLAFLKTL